MGASDPSRWTADKLRDLAPDQASVKAARVLAKPGPWSQTGTSGTLLWGRCQGSGKTPYQVTIDLTGPTLACTCPSRKTPCKHALALMMLWAGAKGEVVQATTVADFAGDWAQGRSADQQAAATKKAKAKKLVDPAAAAKRRERRLVLMTDGLDALERWLEDLIRDGLAAVRRQPYRFWDTAAGRLVDAQMPALADRVRTMPGRLMVDDWADRLLEEISRWYLACRTWRRREQLDADDMAELRAYLGWATPADEVIAGTQITDRWLVAGVRSTELGRLVEQRTWLVGLDTGEVGRVLDFAVSEAAMQSPQVVGSTMETAVARYPGHSPARLRFVAPPVVSGRAADLPTSRDIASATAVARSRSARTPWRDVAPVAIEGLSVVVRHDDVLAVDRNGERLRLLDVDQWQLLALSGGMPTTLFGELQAGRLRPLSLISDDRLCAL